MSWLRKMRTTAALLLAAAVFGIAGCGGSQFPAGGDWPAAVSDGRGGAGESEGFSFGTDETSQTGVYTGDPYETVNGNVPYFTEEELAEGKESFEYYSELDRLGRCGVAFASVGQAPSVEQLAGLLDAVTRRLSGELVTVEQIQDEVERALMEQGHFEAAKSYILYRSRHAELRAARQSIAAQVNAPGLEDCLVGIQKDFDQLSYPLTALAARFAGFAKPEMDAAELLAALTKAAVELTCPDAPKWEFIAARLLNLSFTLRLEAELSRRGIHTLYDKLRYLTDEGLYGSYILEHYSRAEISEAEGFLCPERDKLFTRM